MTKANTLAVVAIIVAVSAGTAATVSAQDNGTGATEVGAAIMVDEVLADLKSSAHRYRQILDRPSMTAGIYVLPAGATDNQRPHDRDEIYYVLAGSGKLVVEADTFAAEPGMALFVAADASHRFIEIDEALDLLVVFGGKD